MSLICANSKRLKQKVAMTGELLTINRRTALLNDVCWHSSVTKIMLMLLHATSRNST